MRWTAVRLGNTYMINLIKNILRHFANLITDILFLIQSSPIILKIKQEAITTNSVFGRFDYSVINRDSNKLIGDNAHIAPSCKVLEGFNLLALINAGLSIFRQGRYFRNFSVGRKLDSLRSKAFEFFKSPLPPFKKRGFPSSMYFYQ